MTFSYWAEQRKRKALLKAVEAELRRRAAQNRGDVYPHWARYVPRYPYKPHHRIIHMLKPGTPEISLCGFHRDNFRAARIYKIPMPDIISPHQGNVIDWLACADRISCPVCYEVMDDVATWVEMAAKSSDATTGVHLRFRTTSDIFCQTDRTNVTSVTNAIMDRYHESTRCSVCHMVYERLYGDSQPQMGWKRHEAIDAAVTELKAQGKL